MLNEAKEKKVITIQLEATITAHGFYQKMGFSDYGPMKTVEIRGSKVRCFPMRMELEQ
jgi:hypothetical protein